MPARLIHISILPFVIMANVVTSETNKRTSSESVEQGNEKKQRSENSELKNTSESKVSLGIHKSATCPERLRQLRTDKISLLLSQYPSSPSVNIKAIDGDVTVNKFIIVEFTKIISDDGVNVNVPYRKNVVEFVVKWIHGHADISSINNVELICRVALCSIQYQITDLQNQAFKRLKLIDDPLELAIILVEFNGKDKAKNIYNKVIEKYASNKKKLITKWHCYDTYKKRKALHLCCKHSKNQILKNKGGLHKVESYCCQLLLGGKEDMKLTIKDKCCEHRSELREKKFREEYRKEQEKICKQYERSDDKLSGYIMKQVSKLIMRPEE